MMYTMVVKLEICQNHVVVFLTVGFLALFCTQILDLCVCVCVRACEHQYMYAQYVCTQYESEAVLDSVLMDRCGILFINCIC